MRLNVLSFTDRLPMGLGEYVRRCFTIDARALASFRIAVALLIIADVLLRSRNFQYMYSDDGAIPQHLAERFTRSDAFSFFYYTEDPTIIALLFALHAIIAIFLLVGYKTRIAMALSFLFVISLDHHNPFVLSYADTLFRLLLFWAIFLPLGERWSIDALQSSRDRRGTVATLGTAAILLQMVMMYFVNGWNKFPSDLWQSGMAGVYVFGIDEMTFLLGDFMREVPLLAQFGALMWFYLLLLSPLLILLHQRRRMMLVFLFMGGHLSFALTVRIGAFAYVALAGLLLFLQPAFWADATATIRFLVPGDDPVNTTYWRVRHFGERMATILPYGHPEIPGEAEVRHKTFVVVLVIAMVTLLVFPSMWYLSEGWNFDNPTPDDNPAEDVFANFGVSQPTWSIFAGPDPRSTDRWYVFPAETADGEVIDVFNEREMSWERPYHELQRQHHTYRERFWMNSVRRSGQGGWASTYYAIYLCETWPEKHGQELVHLNMYEVTERITPETINSPEDRDRFYTQIHRHSCGDNNLVTDIAPPPED